MNNYRLLQNNHSNHNEHPAGHKIDLIPPAPLYQATPTFLFIHHIPGQTETLQHQHQTRLQPLDRDADRDRIQRDPATGEGERVGEGDQAARGWGQGGGEVGADQEGGGGVGGDGGAAGEPAGER